MKLFDLLARAWAWVRAQFAGYDGEHCIGCGQESAYPECDDCFDARQW